MNTLGIYNMALGLIGHDRAIDALPSTSTEAVRCNTFYASARRSIFSFYDWKWLAAEQEIEAPDQAGPLFTHDAITGLLRVLSVTDAGGMPLVYDVVGGRLRTDKQTVTVRYLADNTDPDTWPAMIVDAVAYELAARICGPMGANKPIGNTDTASTLRKQSGAFVVEAGRKSGDGPREE